MQALKLGVPTQQTEIDLPRNDDIRINDIGPVMRAAGNVIELVPMNFSFASSAIASGRKYKNIEAMAPFSAG
jgi:hypothetical protein